MKKRLGIKRPTSKTELRLGQFQENFGQCKKFGIQSQNKETRVCSIQCTIE